MSAGVVIVGAGHGGAQAAIALRQNGYEGAITVVGREPDYPYERPPLSKDYFSGEKSFERILIRPPAFWEEKQVRFMLGRSAISVEPDAHRLTLDGDELLPYDKLIWAGGGDPRPLSCLGATLGAVHAVRNRADVDGLIATLRPGAQVVVIGGGYIGLEAAAVLRKKDHPVVLLEALPRVLARVAGEDLSAFYEAEHRAHGVDLRTAASVEAIEGEGDAVTGVRLADGTVIPGEAVIVGIGIIPSVGPLIKAGAAGANGVDVDEHCRTTLTDVYAIGDCAAHANSFADGAVIRLESVQNANDMANCVAKHICGNPQPYNATPWFWSNQYDLRLQTVGLSTGHDAAITRGDVAARSFSVIYLKGGAVIALDCVNAVKDYVQGKKLVEARAVIAPELLADTAVPLKDMMDL